MRRYTPLRLAGELAEEGYGGAYEDRTVIVLDGTGAEVANVAMKTMPTLTRRGLAPDSVVLSLLGDLPGHNPRLCAMSVRRDWLLSRGASSRSSGQLLANRSGERL